MTEQKPWGGRFHQATDPTVERFSSSIHVDCELAFYDIQGSKAHASMLGHVGILPFWRQTYSGRSRTQTWSKIAASIKRVKMATRQEATGPAAF